MDLESREKLKSIEKAKRQVMIEVVDMVEINEEIKSRI